MSSQTENREGEAVDSRPDGSAESWRQRFTGLQSSFQRRTGERDDALRRVAEMETELRDARDRFEELQASLAEREPLTDANNPPRQLRPPAKTEAEMSEQELIAEIVKRLPER